MERIAIYPGSFDPVTTGHMDIIRRAAGLFDHLIVCVSHNPAKQGLLPVEERIRLLQRCCGDLPNVTVDSTAGLTIRYAQRMGACAMIRGLRSVKDFQSEQELAQINQRLAPEVETVFLLSRPEHACVSSSAVRELLAFGGSLDGFVPAPIIPSLEALRRP